MNDSDKLRPIEYLRGDDGDGNALEWWRLDHRGVKGIALMRDDEPVFHVDDAMARQLADWIYEHTDP
jgi:hypothetical protein